MGIILEMELVDIINKISSPTSLFFIFVILVFILYWVLTFTIFYHLIRFSVGTLPKKLAFIFLFGSEILFCINFVFIMAMNYSLLIERIINMFSI